MILEIPTLTDGTPHYSLRVQLEGVDYQFDFRFGERRGGWVFDLLTLDGVDVLRGQLVTCGRDFLRRCRAVAECPPGNLWAYNTEEPSASDGGFLAIPGLQDLGQGGRCRLYYTESTTAAENEEAGAESPL